MSLKYKLILPVAVLAIAGGGALLTSNGQRDSTSQGRVTSTSDAIKIIEPEPVAEEPVVPPPVNPGDPEPNPIPEPEPVPIPAPPVVNDTIHVTGLRETTPNQPVLDCIPEGTGAVKICP